MDKKTITLLIILLLLLCALFFRWERIEFIDGAGFTGILEQDRFHPLSRRLITTGPEVTDDMRGIGFLNSFITHTISTILYTATGIALIMLLLSSGIIDLEKRREKRELKKEKKRLRQGVSHPESHE